MGTILTGQRVSKERIMDTKDLKKALAGLCITGLIAGSSFTLQPGVAQAASG